jgi:hypothetical protein
MQQRDHGLLCEPSVTEFDHRVDRPANGIRCSGSCEDFQQRHTGRVGAGELQNTLAHHSVWNPPAENNPHGHTQPAEGANLAAMAPVPCTAIAAPSHECTLSFNLSRRMYRNLMNYSTRTRTCTRTRTRTRTRTLTFSFGLSLSLSLSLSLNLSFGLSLGLSLTLTRTLTHTLTITLTLTLTLVRSATTNSTQLYQYVSVWAVGDNQLNPIISIRICYGGRQQPTHPNGINI